MQGFTPRPVNQKGAQGKEASRGITNGSEEGGVKCIATVQSCWIYIMRIMRDDKQEMTL